MSSAICLGVPTFACFTTRRWICSKQRSLYCRAGLQSEEFCLWVVAPPVTKEDALQALQQAVPDFARYLLGNSIEIVAARDWYLQDGTFDLKRVIAGWNEKLARASAQRLRRRQSNR